MMTYKEKVNDLNEPTIFILLLFLNSGSYQKEVSITPVSVFSPSVVSHLPFASLPTILIC